MTTSTVLEVKDLSVSRVVDGAGILNYVNLQVCSGQRVGIVGESGSGKTTLINALIGHLPEGLRSDYGEIAFMGQRWTSDTRSTAVKAMGKGISAIPQNPMVSLNPLFRIESQFHQVLSRHLKTPKKESREMATRLLVEMAMNDPAKVLRRYPHELSGGMAQRVMIALATACDPVLLVADEPTTGLDVTVQNQVLKVLREKIEEDNRTFMVISHDLEVISRLTEYTYVMYAGQIVEQGPTMELLKAPAHPYTQGLVDCLRTSRGSLRFIPGNLPDVGGRQPGCLFKDRCPRVVADCGVKHPALLAISPSRSVACYNKVVT
jgi:oligopeptide/dipeptide ABC transporter ATP-binding protein